MINIRMQHKEVQKLTPKITVVGVGGAGGNAVNNMISSGLQGVEFLVCNTDAQALESSLSETKMQLGVTVTGGLGAGAKPEVGRAAAEESLDDFSQYLEGANMAFITAGMGGGTGTGAAPVIAKACREKGILTVGVVTKPFHFEGTTRMKMAEQGIEEMQQYVDTLIVIPNQNLFRVANEKTTFAEAFKMADSVLQSGVRGVTDLMVMPGLINLDFADIRSAMLEMGKAMMGTGEASGDKRAVESAEKAINNPLLDDVSMKGARGVIINVTGGFDMTLFEVDEACNRIRDEVDPNANIIFGSTFEEGMDGLMRVSVVATGIDAAEAQGRRPKTTNSTVNAMTSQYHSQQQERRVERSQPRTDEAAQKTAQETEDVKITPVPVGAKPSVEVPPPPSAATVARQQSASGYSAPQQFEGQVTAAPTYSEEQRPVDNGARGSVYQDSFIPPKPVESGVRHDEPGSSYGPDLGTLSAKRPAADVPPPAQTVTGSALNLNPPVPGGHADAQQQEKKRTQSLFERFTNPLRGHGNSDDTETQGEETGGQGSGSGGRSFHASQQQQQQTAPLQGSLNIEAPQADSAEDELDIPAFLRRQAN